MRKSLLATAFIAAAAAASLAGSPAEAQGVTFTLGGGSLAVAEPSAATVTGGALDGIAGTALTGSLGTTTITDARGGLTGWASTIAQTTAFTDGDTTIPVGNTKVWVGTPILPTSGVATVTAATYLTQLTGLTLSGTAQAFVSATLVVGNNVTSFNPSIAVTVPSNATAGVYSGVITQTVS